MRLTPSEKRVARFSVVSAAIGLVAMIAGVTLIATGVGSVGGAVLFTIGLGMGIGAVAGVNFGACCETQAESEPLVSGSSSTSIQTLDEAARTDSVLQSPRASTPRTNEPSVFVRAATSISNFFGAIFSPITPEDVAAEDARNNVVTVTNDRFTS